MAARVFEETPVLKAVLSDKLSGSVSSLLATNTAQSSIERLAREGQLLFTSPQRDPIILELDNLKPAISSAQELILKDKSQRTIQVSDIPDSIMIFDTAALPNFHSISLYVHILGPLALLTAIFMGGYWLNRGGSSNGYRRIRILMLLVIASSVIAIIVGPLIEPSFISMGRDAPPQTLLGNLYRAFTAPFVSQAVWLGSVAVCYSR